LKWRFLKGDVALPVAEKIVESVKAELVGSRRKIGSDTGKIVEEALKKSILKVISVESFDFDEFVKKSIKPVSIVFVGVNGTGKTTTVAKMAEALQRHRVIQFVIGCRRYIPCRSYRTNRPSCRSTWNKDHQASGEALIPAAIIYDAIQFAKAKHKDIVLADTAGRLHTNINLMDQLKKVCRVNNPNLLFLWMKRSQATMLSSAQRCSITLFLSMEAS